MPRYATPVAIRDDPGDRPVPNEEPVMSAMENVLSATKPRTAGRTNAAPPSPAAGAGFNTDRLGDRLRALGTHATRYGLVVVLLWIGAMKFTAYEAEGVRPLVANSPLMGWVYGVTSVTAFSALLGVVEIAVGLLIALRPVWPRVSAAGSALAVGMFVTTLTFLFTTPGVWEASLGGFPALSAVPGQFLLKDVVLLGAALWTAGEALAARQPRVPAR
jgi:reactive chlorine resistance protein C